MSNIASKAERAAHTPFYSKPEAVHCWGCPSTVLGRNSGPCDCGADRLQRAVDYAWSIYKDRFEDAVKEAL